MLTLQVHLDVTEKSSNEFLERIAVRVAELIKKELEQRPGNLPESNVRLGSSDPTVSKIGLPKAVGVKEAARLLGLSPATINNYIYSGKLQAVRVGRRVLIPMSILDQVVQKGLR